MVWLLLLCHQSDEAVDGEIVAGEAVKLRYLLILYKGSLDK